MKHTLSLLAVGLALSLLVGVAAPVRAEEDVILRGEADGVHRHSPPAASLLGRAVLDEAALADQRGGTNTHLSEIRAIGSVSEVSASDLVTGHNIVNDGALAGASGMPMLIQNSGNGVLIQNAVILNVEIN